MVFTLKSSVILEIVDWALEPTLISILGLIMKVTCTTALADIYISALSTFWVTCFTSKVCGVEVIFLNCENSRIIMLTFSAS